MKVSDTQEEGIREARGIDALGKQHRLELVRQITEHRNTRHAGAALQGMQIAL